MDILFKNKRGVFLSLILYLYTGQLIYALFPTPKQILVYQNPLISPISLYYVKFIIDIYFLGGIWLWRKTGFYGKIVLELIVYILIFNIIRTNPPEGTDQQTLLPVLTVIFILNNSLLIWAVARKWKYFH